MNNHFKTEKEKIKPFHVLIGIYLLIVACGIIYRAMN